MRPAQRLTSLAASQVLVSSPLGRLMLIALQARGKHVAAHVKMKSILTTHMGLIPLAFMHFDIVCHWPGTASAFIAGLLAHGG